MKIHKHKWDHKGCIGEECEVCLNANMKCTFDNPWCPKNIFTRDHLIGLIIIVVFIVLLFAFGKLP
jgi:hypothetical protein